MKGKVLVTLAALLLVLLSGCGGKMKEYASFDEYPVRTGDLTEMVYSPVETDFTVWAPTAEDVRVMLFKSGDEGNAYKIIRLEPGENGTWNGSEKGDLKGKFYTFNIKVKGKWMGDTPGLMAKAVGINGQRAAIIRMEDTNPEGWHSDVSPVWKKEDGMLLYQLHLQEFSADTASGIKRCGKYLSLTETGTHNNAGLFTGIDHLKELGVTHVQLMPCFDFTGVDEALVGRMQYSQGFSPLNYNVPEGSYATDAHKPEVRIREFKQMVQALHKAGIRVVMDVAYGYTPGRAAGSFERTVPGYFYRGEPDGSLTAGTVAGSEIASERPMARRFIIESLCYWVKEYHIDGFCFDRMETLDVRSMNDIRKALDEIEPSVLLYGKEHSPVESLLKRDSMAIEANIARMPEVAVYADELYRVLFGKEHGRKDRFVDVLSGGSHCADATSSPLQRINYLGLPEGKRPADGLGADLNSGEQVALYKLAQTVMFVSQGIPFIYSGDEWMMGGSNRSPGTLYPVSWNDKTLRKELFDYCKGLVLMRKLHPAFRMADAGQVRRHLEFIPVEGNGLIAFRLKEHAGGDQWGEIIVIINSNVASAKVQIPEGNYTVICKNGQLNLSGMGQTAGGEVVVTGQSALLIYK